MKKLLLLLCALLTGVSGVWAQISVGPSAGTYMDALDGTDDHNGWAAYWKSTAKAADGTTSLLILQATSGMDTSNGDIYANSHAYTLTAPDGYIISGYTFSGTATDGDVTITPTGGSGTLISDGSSLDSPLSVTVRAQSSTFTLTGSGHITNMALVVTVGKSITSVDDLSTTKCYTISTVDRGAWVVQNSATQVTSTTKANLTPSFSDSKQQFAFISYNNKWFLYSVSAGKFISKRGNYTILSSVPNDDVTLLGSSGSTTYPVVVAFQNGAKQAGISNGFDPAVITHYNDLTDDGNRAVILEAGDFDPTTAQNAISSFLTEPSVTSGNYYRLWNLGGDGAYIAPSSFVSTATQSESVILTITEVGTTPVGKKVYSLYDEKSSKYLSYTDVAKSSGNNTERFAWTDAATNSKFVFTVATGTNNINIRPASVADDNWVRLWNNGGGYNLILWTDNGSDVTNTGAYKWNMTDVTINVSYKVMFDNEQKGSITESTSYIGGIPILPASLIANAVPACCVYTFDKETVSEANELFTATVTWNGPVKYTADATAPEYYNLNIRSKYLVYDTGATGEVKLQDTSEPFSDNASWAFIGDPYTGFKVINKSKTAAYDLTYTTVVEERHSNNNVQFVADDNFDNRYWIIDTNTNGFVLRMKENPNIYFHHQNTGTPSNFLRTCSMTEWSAVHNDPGSTIIASTDEDVLFALYDNMKDMSFGPATGEYTTTYVGTDGATADLASIGTIISMQVTSQYPTAYNTLLDMMSKSTLNSVNIGFYRIKGKTSGNYLASGSVNSKYAMSEAEDATTIFYFDLNKKLTNFGSGLCNGVKSDSWDWVTGDNACDVIFHDGNTYGGYGIQSSDVYLYDGGTNADRGGNISLTTSDARYRNWYLEEVTTLPVTISSAKYATLYAPVALTIPDGVIAYAITDGEKAVTMNQITDGIIPAETGVVLYSENAGTYNFAISSEQGTASSDLTGCIATSTRPAGSYILSGGTYGVGFYKDGPTTVAGFKAYLPASGSSPNVKAFRFDTTTEIEGLEAIGQRESGIYDLSGRRVSQPTHGLYIVNGKKVVVK